MRHTTTTYNHNNNNNIIPAKLFFFDQVGCYTVFVYFFCDFYWEILDCSV